MSQYLITGGAGFIGSHLTDRLVLNGHDVTVVDTFTTSTPSNIARRDSDRIEIYEHDITAPFTPDSSPDYILHLASIAAPDAYQANPIQTLRCGSDATRHTLDLAVEYGAEYLFTSTSEVYGDPEIHPQPESYVGHVNPNGPRACYDESKRYAEALIGSYQEEYGINTHIARIFNTYGPRCRDSRVIPTFIQQAVNGNALTVHGDGSQTRSFCYIDDMVDGLLSLLHSDVTDPVNLGNPDEREIREVAQLIRSLTDSGSTIEYHPRPVDDPDKRCPDISRAQEVLGWQPTMTLREGLRKTIDALS